MDALEDEILRIRAQYGTASLAAGLNELNALRPQVGKVAHPSALRARATLEENIAWFATHLGLSTTAFEHAKAAMEYRKKCYEASLGKRGHLVSFARAGLVASNSLLLSSKPLEALVILNQIYQAKAAAGEPLGSDWFRQLATALLQHGDHDDLVRKLYLRSGEEVERESGLDSVAIRMSGDRQWNLLNPSLGWERALELASDVRFRFGALSLEHVMAMNWAAAVGLKLDSAPIEDLAQELLTSLSACNAPFAHQGTITKLLSITPSLKLGNQVKDRWVRFALYQNFARNK